MKKLTEGIVSVVENGTIAIRKIQDVVEIKDGSRVLVIGTKGKFLRILPIHDSDVMLVRVNMLLNAFSETAREIFTSIKERKMKLLHSTGLCPMKEFCVWEGYFQADNQEKIEEFTEWVKSMESVLEVEFIHL
ncbi:MAG: hypothetical protein ACXADL_00660 [Candidatus Thorarchaeota archaeon]|jgi:hypothetical protein